MVIGSQNFGSELALQHRKTVVKTGGFFLLFIIIALSSSSFSSTTQSAEDFTPLWRI